MKRFLVPALAAVATAALAFGAHFNYATADWAGSGPDLRFAFKEAGLGNNQTVKIVAKAEAIAVYACINGGGNHPKASNKIAVTGIVTASGLFSSTKNGSIIGALRLTPPPVPASFVCPPGQRLVLVSVAYDNLRIVDTTNGVVAHIDGYFERTFVNLR